MRGGAVGASDFKRHRKAVAIADKFELASYVDHGSAQLSFLVDFVEAGQIRRVGACRNVIDLCTDHFPCDTESQFISQGLAVRQIVGSEVAAEISRRGTGVVRSGDIARAQVLYRKAYATMGIGLPALIKRMNKAQEFVMHGL